MKLDRANIKFIAADPEREMSNGQRCLGRSPLSEDEIKFLLEEIRAIEADESVFVFNDEKHMKLSTCYNAGEDKIYITRNVFPDPFYSSHPRDNLSPRAFLAHEYYGHRPERERILHEIGLAEDERIPYWRDEAYASLNAAYNAPGLSQHERAMLISEARARAAEASQEINLTDKMKEILYGRYEDEPERCIVSAKDFVTFYSRTSDGGDEDDGESPCSLPQM